MAISTSRPMPSTRSPTRLRDASAASHGKSSTKWTPFLPYSLSHIHINLHSHLHLFTGNGRLPQHTTLSIPSPDVPGATSDRSCLELAFVSFVSPGTIDTTTTLSFHIIHA